MTFPSNRGLLLIFMKASILGFEHLLYYQNALLLNLVKESNYPLYFILLFLLIKSISLGWDDKLSSIFYIFQIFYALKMHPHFCCKLNYFLRVILHKIMRTYMPLRYNINLLR